MCTLCVVQHVYTTLGGSARKTDIGFPGTVSSTSCLSLASETLSTQISSSCATQVQWLTIDTYVRMCTYSVCVCVCVCVWCVYGVWCVGGVCNMCGGWVYVCMHAVLCVCVCVCTCVHNRGEGRHTYLKKL